MLRLCGFLLYFWLRMILSRFMLGWIGFINLKIVWCFFLICGLIVYLCWFVLLIVFKILKLFWEKLVWVLVIDWLFLNLIFLMLVNLLFVIKMLIEESMKFLFFVCLGFLFGNWLLVIILSWKLLIGKLGNFVIKL